MQVGHDLIDVFGHAAEIAALHARIDLVYGLNVRLIGIGRYAVAGQCCHVAEQPRYRSSGGGDCGGDRRIGDFAERAHQVLRRLDRNVIGNSRCRIGPEIGRDLLGGAQADVDVIGDALGVESELGRTRSIDIGHERGGIDFLLKMCVGYARDGIHAPLELLGHAQIRRPVVADSPNVDL